MPLVTGQMVIGRYRIIRLLGQGGFGAVYHAWDINLERPCALKENLDTVEKTRRQFEREARILANLSHPNLPRVTDHFLVPDQGQYLVMDFVEGEDLEERLTRLGRPLEQAEALDWIDQVCDALIYLHRHDPPIIHRDIKPANIRITPQGKAMLVDFGIAKMLTPDLRTTVGARAVTPGFSPPEQYGQGATDARSDIYSVGATLYTLLTGKVPPDSVDVMAGTLPPAPPAVQVNRRVSAAVSQAISQAMQLTRSERFQNVEALKSALNGAANLDGEAAPARKSSDAPVAGTAHGQLAGAAALGGSPHTPVFPLGAAPSIVVPIGRAGSKSKRKKPVAAMAFMGLGGFGLALLGGVALIWLLVQLFQPVPGVLPSATVNMAGAGQPVSSPPATSQLPTLAPTFTNSPAPSDTPTAPPQAGSALVILPTSRIAFVSDHGSDHKDQVYVTNLRAGSYWISPISGEKNFRFDPANPEAPFSDLIAVPVSDGHDLGWWPDWCDHNTALLYEVQDTQDKNFQTIYQVNIGPERAGEPKRINWPGYSKIGVPRCASASRRAVASALDNTGAGSWRLLSFDLGQPANPVLVGDGFPFSGFASWSSDDRRIALMHSENGGPFALYSMEWSRAGEFDLIPAPQGITQTRFPALSPADDANLAYACSSADSWGLCLQNLRENTFSYLLKSLGPVNAIARGQKPAVSGVTPTWSPDGEWIAFASNMDGDWDVYLYHRALEVTINITQQLSGDQFQPAWSKP